MSQSGCSSTGHSQTEYTQGYQEALAATDPASTPSLEIGSDAEEAAIQRVIDLWKSYTVENLEAHFEEVYATNFYFRDAFHTMSDRNELKAYLLESARNVRECTFEFQDVGRHEGNYYFRWIMKVSLKRDPEGHVTQSLGMSHMRFNADGKVIFHQDYWDPTDVVYRHIPVANWLIKKVKDRM